MSEPNVHPLALQLSILQHDCFKAGLYGTAQALSVAVDKVGWELADLMANGTFAAATEFYKKHRKHCQQLVKGTKSQYFAITPGYDLIKHPGNWRAEHWRWFVKEFKRRAKDKSTWESAHKL